MILAQMSAAPMKKCLSYVHLQSWLYICEHMKLKQNIQENWAGDVNEKQDEGFLWV